MAQKLHRVAPIISKLPQADVELRKGKKVPEVCKRLGIAEQTYYRWRQKVGGMQPEIAKDLKAMQNENARLKKRVAELALDVEILKGAVCHNILWFHTRVIAPWTPGGRLAERPDGPTPRIGVSMLLSSSPCREFFVLN